MAGLLAARVLADHFARVTIVERDVLLDGATSRKGVPQARHAHALLARGERILEELFPGLVGELVTAGAAMVDVVADARWYQPGGYRARFSSGLMSVVVSRPLLEAGVRRRILGLPNVTVRSATAVTGLVTSTDRLRVNAVMIASHHASGQEEALTADLVVDASGRGSHAPAWLESLGFERPEEDRIMIGVGYVTRIFERRAGDLPGARVVIVQPTPPHEKRIGVLLPIEGDRWIVTLGGWLGDHAPTDLEGFRAFARTLPAPEIHNVISVAKPLDEGAVYTFPMNVRRRYERLTCMPEGYIVIGDALCSFNPVYGQGMSVSAMEAMELARCLREASPGLRGLPGTFYRRAAAVIDMPWQMAAAADFAYPAVTGQKARGTDLLNWYVGQVQRTATYERGVCRSLVEVTNLLKPPSALFAPRIVWQVARARLGRRHQATEFRSISVTEM